MDDKYDIKDKYVLSEYTTTYCYQFVREYTSTSVLYLYYRTRLALVV